MAIPKKIVLILLVVLVSCAENLDFNQIEDYSTKPSYSFSIAFTDINASNFVPPPGAPVTTEVTQISDFRIFENPIVQKNLVKVDYKFEINNTFNRSFTIETSLLDKDDVLIYRLQDLKIEANKLNTPPTESIDVKSNSAIKNVVKVKVTIKLDDITTPIDANESGVFEFKSGSTIYLETSI
ncbi:hypothetical protein [Polaribacter aquimarinus]|uniref:Lipoprotein n=1 Tax=Polaribacter aquimarinus TaxID=2100726 RepID=A0A2U2JDX4_9FLAO|nr:hypothetical protein [Polaribacter aquimarinus]PWG06539.1 hypothetical protein DIS07_01515 [Polaribacter aquimarinus]